MNDSSREAEHIWLSKFKEVLSSSSLAGDKKGEA